jgi:hypothetical protein
MSSESIEDQGLPVFVVIYMPEDKWLVDTDEDGSLARYDDLRTALDRVEKIRQSGGDACLSVVVE